MVHDVCCRRLQVTEQPCGDAREGGVRTRRGVASVVAVSSEVQLLSFLLAHLLAYEAVHVARR